MAYSLRSVPAEWVHVHGYWLHPFVIGCHAGRANGAKVLMSPHGMFSNYSFSAKGSRKRWALRLGLLSTLRRVDAFHATSEAEREEIRRLGLLQPIHVIPNGVDLPTLSQSKRDKRTLLFLSRIHPKKGLPLLLASWEEVAPERPDWHLVIAGPDEDGHKVELERIVAGRQLPRVRFLGARYGADRDAEMRAASLFVLPSHDENFGLVVAEALANETPVVTTTRTPWSELETVGCGWSVPPTIHTMTAALLKATALDPSRLAEMGRHGRAHVAEHYSWRRIAQRFLNEVFAMPH
jgi:glycosyltransferase involved in cell wall biosynthesis